MNSNKKDYIHDYNNKKVNNDKETLIYDDIIFDGDSIKILMPPYDAVIIAKSENESLHGRYLKEESGKEAPFYAILNNESKFCCANYKGDSNNRPYLC